MEKAIGVIGGVGPYAGIDLVKKIFDNTIATCDQDHLDLYLTNLPRLIEDRTEFLLHGGENPAHGLFASFRKLALMGASVVAIPCNTAHASPIFTAVAEEAAAAFPQVKLLNMIEETCRYIVEQFPAGTTIGLLATQGTHTIGIYRQYLARYPQMHLIEPDQAGQHRVHESIYHKAYGIKAVSPVSERACRIVKEEGEALVKRGARALILGCTELPLALSEADSTVCLIDPTRELARSAIRCVAPEKLRER
jgi:aspartate racemase